MIRFLIPFTFLFSITASAQVTYENALPNITFEDPVDIENSGINADNRLFIVEQAGIVKVVENDPSSLSASTFLDIRNDVNFSLGQELGLLGLAFHPAYEQNGYFYIYYTGSQNDIPTIIVERVSVSNNNINLANTDSRVKLFEFVKNINRSNHNGGCIAFGADGYLYISIGDGGGAGDPADNGQNINTPFGKILRIDIDVDGNNRVDSDGNLPDGQYEIPSTNPFINENGLDEIYAWGIRNTWKMNFDEQTNRLWGGDVGQSNFEEINIITAGNYGWNRFEANSIYDDNTPDSGNTIFPVYAYDHNQGDFSVTGGYVYRGNDVNSTSPNIYGNYIFADYVSGRVWMLEYDPIDNNANSSLLFEAANNGSTILISTFGEDVFGELYFAQYESGGSIYKLTDGITPPTGNAVAGIGNWQNKNNGLNGVVYAQAITQNNLLLIGGDFSLADGNMVNNLAAWDGDNWNSYGGTGTNGKVNAIAVANNGDVYIGGAFTTINGIAANYIARYDGSNWYALNNGTSGPVAVIQIDNNNEVYVGGAFLTADGISTNNIAKWNGSWSALKDVNTNIVGTNNEVRSIAIDDNNIIYVGGNFAEAGGNTALRIANWNGTNWGTLGNGTSGFVEALAVNNNYVYAGGNFSTAGNQTVNRIARFNLNTLQWEKLENGLSKNVKTLIFKDDYLYAGGAFDNALNNIPSTNIITNNVVRWNDANGWEALGNGTTVGTNNLVNSLVFYNDALSAGGNFTQAGSIAANNIACWKDNCSTGNFADADNDGVCDDNDRCPGFDDFFDEDNDGMPNSCDDDCYCANQNSIIVSFNIATGNDDAEEEQAGAMNLNSGDLDMVYDTNNTGNLVKIGLRYENINIPQGANIVSANIKFTTDEIAEMPASFNIFIEDDVNPSSYNNNNFNISNRNYFSTAASWANVAQWNVIGESAANQTTVDIADLISQITNKGLWQEGNAFAFKIEGSGYRTATSFEGDGLGPILTVEYRTICNDADNDGLADACDVCEPFLSVTDNSIITQGTYLAGNSITSNGIVNAATSVIYKAGNIVELQNNFEVKQGANFTVDIESCD